MGMDTKAIGAVSLSIRSLSMDAIQKANSGHPGLPLGAAELAAVLYGEIMKHNPADSKWVDRDRFVLSAGHGSMLLYSILHLAGYKVSMDDIKSFRQVEQIRLMKRFTDNVTIMYDGDSAGIHAALRGIDMVLKEGMNVKIVLLPDGDDPDSFSRKHTLEEVQQFIASHEQDFIGFKTDLLLGDAGDDPLKKANIINEIADTISVIPDMVKRSVYVDSCAAKFKIESDILFARIRSTREKALIEEKAEADRARNRERYEPTGPESPSETPQPQVVAATPTTLSLMETDHILGASEKELLTFILQDGTSPLQFPSDSPFYREDETTSVAEFIDNSLDGVPFANEIYRKVYDAYFILYDEGVEQDHIIKKLLDDPDRTIAFVVAELSVEKYNLSVKDFSRSLTTRASWLVSYVPRAILVYQDKQKQVEQNEILRQLAKASPDEQAELLRRLSDVTAKKLKINQILGREKEN